jgi:hypothetical protein
MAGMDGNPYQEPQQPDAQKRAKSEINPRLLFAWDAFNVLLWLIILGVIAALLLPAGQ